MTHWIKGNPPQPPASGWYAVSQNLRAWQAGYWSRDRGWTNGYQKLLGVRAYCAVPPIDVEV